MNKKILIGGVAAIGLAVGAVTGLYFYVKKQLKKIFENMDDLFDLDGYNYEQKIEKLNEKNEKTEEKVLTDAEKQAWKDYITDGIAWWGIYSPDGGGLIPAVNWYSNDDDYYKNNINTVNLFDGDENK